MFTVWKAIARGVVLESIRRKDLWVVAILGFLIMVASGALGFFGLDGLQSFAKDLGVSVLGLFSSIIAITTTVRLMPDEIKNRTLYPMLARPMRRFDLLLGKLLGAVFVSWLSFLLLAGIMTFSLAMFHVAFEAVMLQYLLCKMLGLVVVCAMTLALSCLMTPSAAATMSFILTFGSGLLIRALVMANDAAPGQSGALFQILNWSLPQFGLFDLGSRVANSNWGSVPVWVVGFLFFYSVAYSSAMMGLGWLKFRRQAL